MPTTLTPTLWAPARGLNTAQPAHLVPMDMASAGFDFVIDEATIAKKRDGYAAVNTSAVSAAPTINSMASLYLSSGTKYEVVGTSNGDIWYDNGGTITTKLFSGLSTSNSANYTQFLDTLIAVDGNGFPQTWTGTATGTISAAASGAKYCETHLNKLFLAGIGASPSRVDYSSTGNFAVFTGSGTEQVQFEQNDGQVITGIKSFSRNELVVFKERSMYKYVGYDKPSFSQLSISKNVGCIEHKTVKLFRSSDQGSLMIFAARDGLYVYDGSTPKKISGYIQDFWDTIVKTRFSQMAATIDFEKGRYLLAVPVGSSTTNNRIICVDLLHPWEDAIGIHFPITLWRVSAQCLNTEFPSATNAQKIVFGGAADGFKYYFGTLFSDNGSAIESYIDSPLMTFGDGIAMEQCLRRIYTAFVGTAGSVTVQTEIKDGSDWVTQDTIQLTGGGAALGVDFQIGVSAIGLPEASATMRTNTAARSRRIKVRLYQSSSTRYFNLQFPVEFYTKPGGQRA